jgi:AraC-like DNA-binding protein
MEQFLNIGLGVGILMLFVLFSKIKKAKEDYFFMSWIVVILLQIIFYDITIYQFELKGLLAIVGFALPLLSAPLLFIYISLLIKRKISLKTVFVHLSPFIIYVSILFLLQLFTKASITTQNGVLSIDSNLTIIKQYYAVPLGLSGILYGFWELFLLKNHRKRIQKLFSYYEKVDLKWVQYIVYASFFLVLIISFLVFGANQFKIFELSDAFAFLGIALSTLLITFGFYGFKQTDVFMNINLNSSFEENNISQTDNSLSNYTKSGLTEEKIASHAKRITELMKNDKPYFQDDLTLPVLADLCNLSSVHLSQVLNQYFQLNFYDFINQYRVEESKKMLISNDYDNLSILGIAYDCGFKSKSSFNRYFKKYNGVSPSAFKKSKL